MKASWSRYELIFKRPARTSRGEMKAKPSYFLRLEQDDQVAWGECGLLPGLSRDDRPNYEQELDRVCALIRSGGDAEDILMTLTDWPSIRFGVEMAFGSLGLIDLGNWAQSPFEQAEAGIPINGLIWMGPHAFQREQLTALTSAGFGCIKFKIGKDYWEGGRDLLIEARRLQPDLEIRTDANGAFSPSEAMEVLEDLDRIGVHSMEQPVAVGQPEQLAELCRNSPVPIALDEELIFCAQGMEDELLQRIRPSFIILKPSLLGGWKVCADWIRRAEEQNIGYWTTSALESQLGLQWIARFSAVHPVPMAQGLGTGSLYRNNLNSDLHIRDQKLWRSATKAFVAMDQIQASTDRSHP